MFDETDADPRILSPLAEAEAILISVQPSAGSDPVFERFAEHVETSRAERIVYLSTIGVYGDHGGAWIDETTPAAPESARGKLRLAIEDEWLALDPRECKRVAVLRLAGIYGPGRNVLDDLARGEARRIDKPGQVFNRIHVEDIGQAISAAFASEQPSRVWNVTDDEPAAAPDIVDYGAKLLGLELPPLIPFVEAELSPMARSFYGANRRVSNAAMKQKLGVRLRYPTYREGLDALYAEAHAGGQSSGLPPTFRAGAPPSRG